MTAVCTPAEPLTNAGLIECTTALLPAIANRAGDAVESHRLHDEAIGAIIRTACFRVMVPDGMLVRVYEYYHRGKIQQLLPPPDLR